MSTSTRRIFAATSGIIIAVFFAALPQAAHASAYTGGGMFVGISASMFPGLTNATSLTDLILKIITLILNIILLLAVVAIIIAGIYLITSNGEETQKEKAKKIIYYAIAGIVVVLLSRSIVIFVNHLFF